METDLKYREQPTETIKRQCACPDWKNANGHAWRLTTSGKRSNICHKHDGVREAIGTFTTQAPPCGIRATVTIDLCEDCSRAWSIIAAKSNSTFFEV